MVSPRLAALVCLPLGVFLACSSGGSSDTSTADPDSTGANDVFTAGNETDSSTGGGDGGDGGDGGGDGGDGGEGGGAPWAHATQTEYPGSGLQSWQLELHPLSQYFTSPWSLMMQPAAKPGRSLVSTCGSDDRFCTA